MRQLPFLLSILTGMVPGLIQATKQANPILPDFASDPSIAAFGDTYYIYPTTDKQKYKSFYVYKSRNLVDWTKKEEPILTLNEKEGAGNCPWAKGKANAPTIIERNGKYYLYHVGRNSLEGSVTIGVAVADSPEGPFTGEPKAMITGKEKMSPLEVIDPMAFRDPKTGKYWLYWGNGRLLHAELKDDMVSIDKDTLSESRGLTKYYEAPFVMFHKGLYHMTWSTGTSGSEWCRVGYATGKSATGPWENHGVILEKRPELGILGTGHHSILNVPDTDDWYIVYNRFAITNETSMFRRHEVAIDRMTFDEDTGRIKPVTPTLEGVPAQEIKV